MTRTRRRLACLTALLALAGAEIVIALGHVLAGQIADAVVLVVLVNAGAPELRALALVALIRVVGPGLPLGEGSAAAGEAVLAVAIGLAALKLAPAVGVERRALASLPSPLVLAATAAGGLALGYAAYRLGAPALASRDDPPAQVALVAAAVAAAALVEELVFRGLVQMTLQRLAGGVGALAATALFACLYLSAGPASLVLLAALAGLVCALSVARSGVLGGAAIAHPLFACGAVVAWPLILGPAGAAPPETRALIAVTVAALVGAVLLASGPVADPPPPARKPGRSAQPRMRKTSPSRPR